MSKIPSANEQAQRLVKILEDESNADLSVLDVAKRILKATFEMWQADIEDPPLPLKEGMAFKVPWIASKVYHVAWIGPEYPTGDSRTMVWVIDASSDYGTLCEFDSKMWRIVVPSTAKAGAAGNNKAGWKKGDLVSLNQRMYRYEVIEVGDKTVLMRSLQTGSLQVDSNANLERYYIKESK